jgi:hypothetical protein
MENMTWKVKHFLGSLYWRWHPDGKIASIIFLLLSNLTINVKPLL